jgi:hypothetical protein
VCVCVHGLSLHDVFEKCLLLQAYFYSFLFFALCVSVVTHAARD